MSDDLDQRERQQAAVLAGFCQAAGIKPDEVLAITVDAMVRSGGAEQTAGTLRRLADSVALLDHGSDTAH